MALWRRGLGLGPLVLVVLAQPRCCVVISCALLCLLRAGGIASGVGELFCSEPLRQPDAAAEGDPENAESGSEAEARKQAAPRRPKYCGLLLCRQGGAAAPAAAGGMAAQGMSGAAPLLRGLNVVREFGFLQHPNNHGWVAKPGWRSVSAPTAHHLTTLAGHTSLAYPSLAMQGP